MRTSRAWVRDSAEGSDGVLVRLASQRLDAKRDLLEAHGVAGLIIGAID
jgi:hypothetical protein